MTIIHPRYKILETLGQGGIGTTYKAEDLETKQCVAVKVVSLRQTSDWKTLDLFEREVRVLKQLNHPGIPQYLDSFEVDTENDRLFCIVQALAPGKTLAEWIQKGWRPNEETVSAIASQLLDILLYLQTFLPPILHRDIKPQNILRDRSGSIYLVDFGAVQDTYRQTVTGGSTVVGTLGYMAPEQFLGKATLATDLYALGTTLLFLLTGKDPIQLQQTDDLELQIPNSLELSANFKRWLKRCIESAEEDRFPNASAALLALQGRTSVERVGDRTPQRPRNSKISLLKSDRTLQVYFSGDSYQPEKLQALRRNIALSSGYVIVALTIFQFIANSRLNHGGSLLYAWFMLVLIGTIPLVTAFLVQELHLLLKPTLIAITDQFITLRGVFTIADQVTALRGTTKAFEFYQTLTYELPKVEAVCLGKDIQGQSIVLIKTQTKDFFRFGKHLSSAEQRWLVHELQTFIQFKKQHLEQQAQEQSEHQQNTKRAVFDLLFQQGIIEYKNNRFEQSATLFNAILLVDSSCAEAHNNLGVIHYQQKEFSSAIESFQTALQLAPSYWAARTNLAIVFQAQGSHEQEIVTYGTPCAAGQNTGADEYTLILLPPWRDTLEQAIASHQVPPADEPMIAAKQYCAYADLLQFQGNFTDAIDIYRHVLTLVKHDRKRTAEIYAELAWVFAITYNLKEAQLCLQKCSKIAPNIEHPTVRYTKALINYQQTQSKFQTPNREL